MSPLDEGLQLLADLAEGLKEAGFTVEPPEVYEDCAILVVKRGSIELDVTWALDYSLNGHTYVSVSAVTAPGQIILDESGPLHLWTSLHTVEHTLVQWFAKYPPTAWERLGASHYQ